MTRLSSLSRGTAVNLAGRAAVVAAGLALTVLVARLGPEPQGAFALFVACESIVLALCSGFGLVLARAHSQQASDTAALHGTMLVSALVFGAGAAAVLWAVSTLSGREPYRHLWLLALAAPWVLLVPTVCGAWMGQGRLVALNLLTAAGPLAVLALLLGGLATGAVQGSTGTGAAVAVAVLGAWALGKAVVGAAALAAAVRAWGWSRPQWALLRRWGGFIAVIGLTNLVSLLNYRVNLFLVERLAGLAPVGVYSVAVSVAELLWLFSSAVTTALYARIGAPDADAAATAALQAVRIGALGVLCAAPLLLGAAWFVLPAVLGEAYRAAWWPLVLLMPGTLAYSAASGVSAWFTNQQARPHRAGAIALLSMLLNLGLSAWWIPRWGIAGAAAATSVSYTVAMGCGLALFFKLSGLPLRRLWRPAPPGPEAQLRPS